MAQNFIECDREQGFLLPPDVRDWLPENHLAWTVLDAVAEMDLCAFHAGYRSDGRGRAAYDPRMMGWIQLVVATLPRTGAGPLHSPGKAVLHIATQFRARGRP